VAWARLATKVANRPALTAAEIAKTVATSISLCGWRIINAKRHEFSGHHRQHAI
jgi:hypothetical protein